MALVVLKSAVPKVLSFDIAARNMAQFALTKGSVLPAAKPDVLRLYSMRFCPYAQRTRIVLLHKNISHETINVNLKHKADWLLARNPLGLVPIIEYKGQVIYESAVCDDLLEDLFPQAPLRSSCPFQRSKDRMLMGRLDAIAPPSLFYKLLRPQHEKYGRAQAQVTQLLDHLEQNLADKRFLAGETMGMVDAHAWPWIERMPVVQRLIDLAGVTQSTGEPYDVFPVSRYPCLHGWAHRMTRVPAVRDTIISPEHHAEFMVSLGMGQPDYDIGLERGQAKL